MRNWYMTLGIITMLLGACTPTPAEPLEVTRFVDKSAYSTPTRIVLPTQIPLPDFLYYVFPEPGETYSLDEFAELIENFGTLPVSGEVFFDVRMESLVEEGDDFDSVDDFVPRVSVKIDDRLFSEPHGMTRTDASPTTFVDPDTGGVFQIPGGAPFRLYYTMAREPGLHTVEVEIRRTSGEVVNYTWSFVLTE